MKAYWKYIAAFLLIVLAFIALATIDRTLSFSNTITVGAEKPYVWNTFVKKETAQNNDNVINIKVDSLKQRTIDFKTDDLEGSITTTFQSLNDSTQITQITTLRPLSAEQKLYTQFFKSKMKEEVQQELDKFKLQFNE